nr:IS66 family insertion sequence element accessory protein TnpB [Halotalea alkalilenta]
MRPDTKVKTVYLYPKPVDFRKSIDGLAALVELDIKVAVFDPVLFVFLNKTRNRVKILYWERNGFCLWLKRLQAERFKTKPNGQEPYAWLRCILERLPSANSVEDFEALLPWNCLTASAS